jgi:hypothetical protein
VVVTGGLTFTEVPLTVPTPWLIFRLVAPVTTQLSVLDCPAPTFAGAAAKLVMEGKLAVAAAGAVLDPKLAAVMIGNLGLA